MPGFVWHVFRILMGLFIVLFMHSHRADPWAVDRFQPSYQALYGMRSSRPCQALYGMVFGMVLSDSSSGGVIVCYRFQPTYRAFYGMRSGQTCQALFGMHSVSGVVSVRGTWYLGSVKVAMPGWYGHLLGGFH